MPTKMKRPTARQKLDEALAAIPPENLDGPRIAPVERRKAYSIEEARQLLGGISRATLYALIRNGELKTVIVAGRRLVPDDAMDALISASYDNFSEAC